MTEIEKKAKAILKRHNLYSIPIDPVVLANVNGIKVNNAVFSEEGISGLVAKRGDNVSILVKNNDSPYRKRFTIAHELGHVFLHLAKDGDFVDNNLDLFRDIEESDLNSNDASFREVESNYFAACLLMPPDLVIQAYRDDKNLNSLANKFKVSESAMGIRLNKLGLLK
ncbi:MAG: ImmA/IrrE family metallo-endopeptidase [Ignavibacteria bacterium]|jgi:Zn-dependent peptidase ImmA (M78 family)|nr:ImmA/IrrE family metallo-endopeptidase [Ignavibacteria bacterium]MCU7522280.1 ImmA/IrrE family metallo-endopeptidase [Ignavibacteria bacterium]